MKRILIVLLSLITTSIFAQTRPHWLQTSNRPHKDIRQYGALGDGITNDKAAFLAAFADVENGDVLEIPSGEYNVTITSDDLYDIGFARDYAFGFLDGKENIKICGAGTINFRNPSSWRRGWFAIFQDCQNITIEGVTITGNFSASDGLVSNNRYEYGVMFYNCNGGGIINTKIGDIMVPFSVTGQPISPATVSAVSRDISITNNYFYNFQQSSTYGAGAARLLITNNHFVDPYVAIKLSRNPYISDDSIGQSRGVIISNNSFYWSPGFELGAVDLTPTYCYAPQAVEIQAPIEDVIISGNTIDSSLIASPTLPFVTYPSAIALLNRSDAGGEEYSPANITISNNIIRGLDFGGYYAIHGTGSIRALNICNNTISGGIKLASSFAFISYYVEAANIKDNTINYASTLPPTINIDLARINTISIDGNTLIGSSTVLVDDYDSAILVGSSTIPLLNITGNSLSSSGAIKTSADTRTPITNTRLYGNVCGEINLVLSDAKSITATGNQITTNDTAITIDIDSTSGASTTLSIYDNSCYGSTVDGPATILNLNYGKLKLSNNGFSSSPTPFILGSGVTIREGFYFGDGPPSANAFAGVQYFDYGAATYTVYIKKSYSGAAKWETLDSTP